MGLLGHMVVLFLVFKGTSILFSIVVVSIYIPSNSVGGFPFHHTLSRIVSRFFDNGHPDQREVIPHCSFDLHSLIISDVEHLFSRASWASVCLPW